MTTNARPWMREQKQLQGGMAINQKLIFQGKAFPTSNRWRGFRYPFERRDSLRNASLYEQPFASARQFLYPIGAVLFAQNQEK